MSLRKLLIVATFLAAPLVASAQSVDGIYLGAGAGIGVMSDSKLGIKGKSANLSSSGIGASFLATLGYGYGNGVRAEIELLGITGDDKVSGKGLSGKSSSLTFGAMLNGLYDFNVGLPITPYIGAGVGYVGVQERSFSITNGASRYLGHDGTLGSPAVQGIVGASTKLTDHTALTLEYRVLDKLQSRNVGGTYITGATATGASAKVDSELDHSVLLGVRYALNGGPEPAPVVRPAPRQAAAPLPAPAKSYIVFFDFDSAELTGRAQQIIAEAAKNMSRASATRIDLAGHADKAGIATYNQALSLKRANNVAAELVRLGVPRGVIGISAFGDTKPLIPTAAGVREPQNRRVEIVLH